VLHKDLLQTDGGDVPRMAQSDPREHRGELAKATAKFRGITEQIGENREVAELLRPFVEEILLSLPRFFLHSQPDYKQSVEEIWQAVDRDVEACAYIDQLKELHASLVDVASNLARVHVFGGASAAASCKSFVDELIAGNIPVAGLPSALRRGTDLGKITAAFVTNTTPLGLAVMKLVEKRRGRLFSETSSLCITCEKVKDIAAFDFRQDLTTRRQVPRSECRDCIKNAAATTKVERARIYRVLGHVGRHERLMGDFAWDGKFSATHNKKAYAHEATDVDAFLYQAIDGKWCIDGIGGARAGNPIGNITSTTRSESPLELQWTFYTPRKQKRDPLITVTDPSQSAAPAK
jgi:hypothetical protein